MPGPSSTTLYTENSEKWKLLADIDYFTQFVTAWIPFNAWYKNYFPNLSSDREAIDHVKTQSNSFRNRLASLLEADDEEGVSFRGYIGTLHHHLERKRIENRGKRLSFRSIDLRDNTPITVLKSYRRTKYDLSRGVSGSPKEIEIAVSKLDGTTLFSFTQRNGYDPSELPSITGYETLTVEQRRQLTACYRELDPCHDLLDNSAGNDAVKCGDYRFTKDYSTLCSAIIESLYLLRNCLFHGQIVPDRDTNTVYGPAYHILRALVEAL